MKKILITGGCGFVGSNIAIYLKKKGYKINSIDNLSRKGSRYNLKQISKFKIKNFKLDISYYKNLHKLPKYDLIIDCCAEAAVEVSRKNFDKVIGTNLIGTINILKKVKKDKSKIIFLSSSRVYPMRELNNIVRNKVLKNNIPIKKMINEKSNLNGPKTIYGLTKLASEMFIEEFSYAFNIKYIINRCGVISGPLQFGKQDQGFVSLWIWNHIIKKNLKYIGYGGFGHQVRDVLHIDDLCNLILLQIKNFKNKNNLLLTVGGSKKSYVSLNKLTKICEKITNNKIKISKQPKTSIYDIPYFITDNKVVTKIYGWRPKSNINKIVNDIYKWLKTNQKVLKGYL